jgi:hypothetical protein
VVQHNRIKTPPKNNSLGKKQKFLWEMKKKLICERTKISLGKKANNAYFLF